LNLLMLVFNQTGRGTYWRALGFARELVQRGHFVTLVSTSPGVRSRISERQVDGVCLVEMPGAFPSSLRFGWDPWDAFQRLSWLREKKFDLVHAFETRPVCIWPALQAHRNGARLFFDWCDWFGRGGSVEERPNPFVRNLIRPFETYFEDHFRTFAEGTTVINSFLRQRAIKLGVKPASIRLIRNGSDCSFRPLDHRDARRYLGLPETAPLVGFVGGMFNRDAKFMAAAFNYLSRLIPDLKLVLVGYFNRPIEKLVENPSAIIRSGPVESAKVYTFLSACDVGWLPFENSGANRGRWPFKLNDYMTVARPVISTSVGDLAEFIPAYRLGLATAVDPLKFAQETALLLTDKERARTLGKNARKAAQEVFSWQKMTDELEAFYTNH
jgi:glycosyltransferase involved in cell wall biosynthesis